jgi:predicted ATPase
MIKSIHYKNFKALRDATLPLGPFTLIVGANGSGKSTAMQALAAAREPGFSEVTKILSAGTKTEDVATVEIEIDWEFSGTEVVSRTQWQFRDGAAPKTNLEIVPANEQAISTIFPARVLDDLRRFRIFSFDAQAMTTPVQLQPQPELMSNGSNLAVVLDNLRDSDPERFDALTEQLGHWLPEFDRILFESPSPGHRAFLLRTLRGRHRIPAADLSQGTLFVLTYLTLAYLPNHPPIVCFEEPERGVHPRLLREIQDGMYRLAYPEQYGESRPPVQVIAISHSPYLLDLYRDHPEEVVIAHKAGQDTLFERLSDTPHAGEILQDAPLGEIWYSGILGGVPVEP